MAPAKKKAKVEGIERTPTERRVRPTSRHLRILSVNVAGLRAVLDPAKNKLDALVSVVQAEDPDMLCLNEHKLNPGDVDDAKEKLNDAFPEFPVDLMQFACCTARKGYSGVAVLRKRDVGSVEEGIRGSKDPIVSSEGRLLTVEFPDLAVIAAYVPNSGQDLKRLEYRVETWDRSFSAYVASFAKPVVVVGDLNVARAPMDIHNMYARPDFRELHEKPLEDQYVGLAAVKKQAGLTVEERESFGRILADSGVVDTFRHLHPQATGRFTYFSQRAVQNRPKNKGLRLDYVLASQTMCSADSLSSSNPKIHDSYILDDAPQIADHCPVGCDILLPEEAATQLPS
ncbi:hypothetical protein CTAYLR_007421 [Chrysophaeum taylorii]|uniref:DNA repair nuclease/redox regulator APEX1 n=1 Tax=Chrysophaeum taylorii TaxID=2483200 RepID=A0AAD7U6F9_9STRA|nr:hypothetical protein CTAYLR_007421 [Chrysophaeum taylorii]